MTESQIERHVEFQTNRFDHHLMQGDWTQAEYEQEMRTLNQWAEQQYKANKA